MVDALSEGKFGNSIYLSDFPCKVRVLTTDPIVHLDNYGNTRYAFVVWNYDENRAMILDKGPSFATRFKQIHTDKDFGGNIQAIDLKISTNGKSGQQIRYNVDPVGSPSEFPAEKLRAAARINLTEKITNGIRLSEVNSGRPVPGKDLDDVGLEDIFDTTENNSEPINIEDIPF